LKFLVVQHVEFEEPGTIAEWALARGHELAVAHPYRGEDISRAEGFDGVVVMGGPMSVTDEDSHPWLVPEKRLVRRAIEGGKFVLGVCLGAQLVAECLGARVYPGPEKEIGWYPVALVSSTGSGIFAGLPPRIDAFHWHGETFDNPPGVERVARSEAYENQAFAAGRRILGMQFHLEMTERNVRLMIDRCSGDIRGGRFVQTPEAMLAAPPAIYGRMRRALFGVLDNLCRAGFRGEALEKEGS
jgi:GMP synthase-like glutamine amidotransferase